MTKGPLKIGITGTSGFIGSAVQCRAEALGAQCVVLDGFVRGAVNEPVDTGPLDWVLHFGASARIPQAFQQPGRIYAENLASTLAALDIARHAGARFVFMSSYVYGVPGYLPIDEAHPVAVLNPYMGSKLVCETVCSHYHHLYKMDVVVIRGFTFYGPGQQGDMLIPSIVTAIDKGVAIGVRDPEPVRDYVYIDDFVDLIGRVLASGFRGFGIYNVGGGVAYRNIDVATLANRLAGNPVDITVLGQRRQNDVMACYADTAKATADFGWAPQTGLEDGLCRCLAQHGSR